MARILATFALLIIAVPTAAQAADSAGARQRLERFRTALQRHPDAILRILDADSGTRRRMLDSLLALPAPRHVASECPMPVARPGPTAHPIPTAPFDSTRMPTQPPACRNPLVTPRPR